MRVGAATPLLQLSVGAVCCVGLALNCRLTDLLHYVLRVCVSVCVVQGMAVPASLDLLTYYRKRIDEFEAEREEFLNKFRDVEETAAELERLQWCVLQRCVTCVRLSLRTELACNHVSCALKCLHLLLVV